jgi:hypothetical protein
MNREEILKAIRVCGRELGRTPSLRELRLMAGVPAQAVYRRLGSLREALEMAGLRAIGPGFSPAEPALLLDWAAVARKLQKVPSVMEYKRTGRFSNKPFHTRYGNWIRVPEAFKGFVRKGKLERQWRDVLKKK